MTLSLTRKWWLGARGLGAREERDGSPLKSLKGRGRQSDFHQCCLELDSTMCGVQMLTKAK